MGSKKKKKKRKRKDRKPGNAVVKATTGEVVSQSPIRKDLPINIRAQRLQYQGPIPPPAMLDEYEKICPGSAQKIVEQFQKQSDHRIYLEKKVIDSDIKKSFRGQVFGFLVAIIGMGISLYAIMKGYSIEGSIFGGVTLVSLVSVFVIGKKAKDEELEKKRS